MENKQFSDIVEYVMKKRPAWFGLDSDVVASETDVSVAETRVAIRFPREYRAFVTRYGGGYFAFANVYSVDPASDWNIVERNSSLGLLERGFLAFSENGCGDYYGFQFADGVCDNAVFFFDHEIGEICSTDYSDLYDYLIDIGLRGGIE